MYFGLWILVFLGALVVELATATSLVSIWFCVGALFAPVSYTHLLRNINPGRMILITDHESKLDIRANTPAPFLIYAN